MRELDHETFRLIQEQKVASQNSRGRATTPPVFVRPAQPSREHVEAASRAEHNAIGATRQKVLEVSEAPFFAPPVGYTGKTTREPVIRIVRPVDVSQARADSQRIAEARARVELRPVPRANVVRRVPRRLVAPQNPALYDAALGGFVAGVNQARALQSGVAGAYAALVAEAQAFAGEVDGLIAPIANVSFSQTNFMGVLCAGLVAQQYPLGLSASAFAVTAGVAAALFAETSPAFTDPASPGTVIPIAVPPFRITFSGTHPSGTTLVMAGSPQVVLADMTLGAGTYPIPPVMTDGQLFTIADSGAAGSFGAHAPTFTVSGGMTIELPTAVGTYSTVGATLVAVNGNPCTWVYDLQANRCDLAL